MNQKDKNLFQEALVSHILNKLINLSNRNNMTTKNIKTVKKHVIKFSLKILQIKRQ